MRRYNFALLQRTPLYWRGNKARRGWCSSFVCMYRYTYIDCISFGFVLCEHITTSFRFYFVFFHRWYLQSLILNSFLHSIMFVCTFCGLGWNKIINEKWRLWAHKPMITQPLWKASFCAIIEVYDEKIKVGYLYGVIKFLYAGNSFLVYLAHFAVEHSF